MNMDFNPWESGQLNVMLVIRNGKDEGTKALTPLCLTHVGCGQVQCHPAPT